MAVLAARIERHPDFVSRHCDVQLQPAVRAAGQIALVVEAERTKRAEVEAALDILDACPTLQLLLNRSALQVSDGFRGSVPNSGDVAVGAHQA